MRLIRSNSTFTQLLFALMIVFISTRSESMAQDVQGSQDHPLIGRYAGSMITYYKAAAYDEATLLRKPHDFATLLDRNAVSDRAGAEWLPLQGATTEIRYQIPTGRSSLEVIRNYSEALQNMGFRVLFECSDKACFEGAINDPYLLGQQIDTANGETTLYADHARYLLAVLKGPSSETYVSVLAGEYQQTTTAFLEVVEVKAMETEKIEAATTKEISGGLEADGRINIYGILFDSGEHAVKPEAMPAMEEIAKTLVAQPDLQLMIVGHTDDNGTPDYNMSLSERRAASVVKMLIDDYGIDADRLASRGAGLSEPIASNTTAEGKAKNRRVELIAQ